MKNQILFSLIVFSFLAIMVIPTDASAYIDPGTGSYILQMIAAGVLGGLFAVKMFWMSVKQFFRRIFFRDKA